MSTIEVKRLTKTFGTLKAVDNVDLDVAQGETVCLLGPSGCGKTTTLRMIAGLEHATSGDVLIAGRRVNDLGAAKRNVAMTFQFYALYPSLTVAQNLVYPLHAEGLGAAENQRRLADVARILQLEHVLDRRPTQLAEGEKQRVAVGRCIIREASCFLFDEPLSRLDVSLRETMRGEIKAVLQRLDKATVIVTHDQLEALTMADRIAVMRAGVIEQVASPHDIFTRPANLFVAAFIGTPQMNLMEGALERVDDGTQASIRLDGGKALNVPVDPAVAALPAGARITLGVRPRHIELASAEAPDGLTAGVDLIEPLGAEMLLHMTEGEHELRVVCDARAPVREGERASLRFRQGAVHVFDDAGRAVRS